MASWFSKNIIISPTNKYNFVSFTNTYINYCLTTLLKISMFNGSWYAYLDEFIRNDSTFHHLVKGLYQDWVTFIMFRWLSSISTLKFFLEMASKFDQISFGIYRLNHTAFFVNVINNVDEFLKTYQSGIPE